VKLNGFLTSLSLGSTKSKSNLEMKRAICYLIKKSEKVLPKHDLAPPIYGAKLH
jgi:hypothetical protein